MNISGIVTDLKKEFQKKIDEALTQELQQLEMDEAERAELAEQLPGLTLPKLTGKEEQKAEELLNKLDSLVERLAGLAADIGLLGSEYKKTIAELNKLLANKHHNVITRHTGSKLKFMLTALGQIIEMEVYNGIMEFRSLPDKDFILSKLNNYRGI